jgi:hypothetical protein
VYCVALCTLDFWFYIKRACFAMIFETLSHVAVVECAQISSLALLRHTHCSLSGSSHISMSFKTLLHHASEFRQALYTRAFVKTLCLGALGASVHVPGQRKLWSTMPMPPVACWYVLNCAIIMNCTCSICLSERSVCTLNIS